MSSSPLLRLSQCLLLLMVFLAAIGCIEGELQPVVRELTLEVQGEGSVKPDPGVYPYTEDTVVNLTAEEADGWSFSHWEGDVLKRDQKETSIVVTGKQTVTAVFTEIHYSLAIVVEGSGSVKREPDLQSYRAGEVVHLEAVAASDWLFSLWEGDVADELLAATTITMDGPQTVTAVFTPVSDTGSLAGTVYLDRWDIELVDAVVTDLGTGTTVTTDEDGYFHFADLPSGRRDIRVEALYNTIVVEANVQPNNVGVQSISVPFAEVTFSYFDQLVQQMQGSMPAGTRRWPLGKEIAVYIEEANVPADYQPHQGETAWYAVAHWAEVIPRFSVRRVYQQAQADVTIDWVPPNGLGGHVVGQCTYSWDHTWTIVGAEIILDVGFEGEALQAIASHEFGHSLRLGHSPYNDDIMYERMHTARYPSAREIEAVRILYSIPTNMLLVDDLAQARIAAVQGPGGPGTATEQTKLAAKTFSSTTTEEGTVPGN